MYQVFVANDHRYMGINYCVNILSMCQGVFLGVFSGVPSIINGRKPSISFDGFVRIAKVKPCRRFNGFLSWVYTSRASSSDFGYESTMPHSGGRHFDRKSLGNSLVVHLKEKGGERVFPEVE